MRHPLVAPVFRSHHILPLMTMEGAFPGLGIYEHTHMNAYLLPPMAVLFARGNCRPDEVSGRVVEHPDEDLIAEVERELDERGTRIAAITLLVSLLAMIGLWCYTQEMIQ